MCSKAKEKAGMLAEYTIVYIDAPQYPHIECFIYTQRKTIYINLATKKGAKIIKLVQ